jgi:toxin ParE1/3/4
MHAYFTPQAEIDLEEIGDYIALDNPERAVSFIGEMRKHCEKIAHGPLNYAARPELGDAVRICTHGNYLIVFEPLDAGAIVLRVLHGARSLSGFFGSSSA